MNLLSTNYDFRDDDDDDDDDDNSSSFYFASFRCNWSQGTILEGQACLHVHLMTSGHGRTL